MEKQKRWQFYLIILVIVLTIYNILPTIFYYTKPLDSPIDAKRANKIAESISKRVNDLEGDSIDWVNSFCKMLKINPTSVEPSSQIAGVIEINFKAPSDAKRFKTFFPRAGSLIPFVPSQLFLYDSGSNGSEKQVLIQRRIPVKINLGEVKNYYTFSDKMENTNTPTEFYKSLVYDRLLQMALLLGGPSEHANLVLSVINSPHSPGMQEVVIPTLQNLITISKTLGENSPIAERYFSSFTQIDGINHQESIKKFITILEQYRDGIKLDKIALQREIEQLDKESESRITKEQKLEALVSRENLFTTSISIIRNNQKTFSSGSSPLDHKALLSLINESSTQKGSSNYLQTISLSGKNPFVKSLVIDWNNSKIYLHLHEDITALKTKISESKNPTEKLSLLDQLLYDEIAILARQTGEFISYEQNQFEITLSSLQDSSSLLAFDLSTIAKAQVSRMLEVLNVSWNPLYSDLQKDNLKIVDYDEYENLPAIQKKLCFIVYAPALYGDKALKGFRNNSIYIIAKGLDSIIQQVSQNPDSDSSKQFSQDFNALNLLMRNNGFFGYRANSYIPGTNFANDYIFELEDYFQVFLKATREEFKVYGTKRYATLEFSNVEQRILTENKIDTMIHEDLLKWRDSYQAARVGLKGASPFDFPPPTKSPLWNNFTLNYIKYFRGDDRKVLHWGLDLSGGKTVQIELRDFNNRQVTNESDIKQGINELYRRVNKMGVSEVNIRQEGKFITLDFPGSQGLSASELVKASSMHFHIVNEKFTENNPALADSVRQFLQEVWNEAVVTNKKDAHDVNLIAWRHLYGNNLEGAAPQPKSEAAKNLYDNGLRIANPDDSIITSTFDDTYSSVAIYRGDEFTDWHGQTTPLVVIFRNYALEGSNLENIRASYDPTKGNFLSFDIKRSVTTSDGQKLSPRDDLFAWSSQFSKDEVQGTVNESYSHGEGWRMAVILNDYIISAPTLNASLRDSAMITGSFTQREISQLETDLKAGSLSFTPRIMSEKNVSPELGIQERFSGVLATVISLALAIITMISYYRFGGVVASIAVIFNLLVMWAALQNIQATMTLAGIAGIILTVGMAVDANVLVFERFREEFAVTHKIIPAIHSAYKKAFSAILDSNVTTIIAALILLNFDSGPIKGFALTLIIGIVSSMFTALFVTKYFFQNWVKNPKNTTLKMANLIKSASFNFLKYTKASFIGSLIILVIGGSLLVYERHSIFGMDFSGGFALSLEIEPKNDPKTDYRKLVEDAFVKANVNTHNFQIRELNPSNNVRIFLSKSMEQPGEAFSNMPKAEKTDLKINWVLDTLAKSNIKPTERSLQNINENWTDVSGQMSSSMRNASLIGLGIALLCIFLYIMIRFEFKYAISATLCIIHDVFFALAMIGLLYFLGVNVQIDLHTVAAIMTIVGYSLNDTIIVFDRIREETKLAKSNNFKETINHSLNITLSRTLITSSITLLVLIPLIILGQTNLFGFALVMAIGVIFGTLSSLFIAAPLMYYFHKKELKKRSNHTELLLG